MKKFFKEFKEFITRGNVIDLAVGMIIGAAFTAIVNALVNNIFKPLINAIPINNLSGLITMLVPRDANGASVAFGSELVDLSKSVYIDWGAFIMAIINFLLTALVLFIIIKIIMSAKGMVAPKHGELVTDKEYRAFKKQGKTHEEIMAIDKERVAEKKAADEKAAAEKAANSTEGLLKQILELLKENPEVAAKLKESASKDEQPKAE